MAVYRGFATNGTYVYFGFEVTESIHNTSDVQTKVRVFGYKTAGSNRTSSNGSVNIILNGASNTVSFPNTGFDPKGGDVDICTFYKSWGAGCGDAFTIQVVLNMPNCSVGNNNTSTAYTISIGHSYAASLYSSATCTAAATYIQKCTKCGGTAGKSPYASGSALGHATPSDYTYTASNGITNGARYKNCTRCSTRLSTQYGVWANAGTGIASTSGTNWYNSGASVTIDATVATGYQWSQWSYVHNGTGYTNATKNLQITSSLGNAWSLTATGTPNTYTVDYNGNGATGGNTADSRHTYDTSSVLVTNGYTKPGYKFIGWATSPTGSVVYTDAQSVLNLTATNGGTVTLYAVWELAANARVKVNGTYKPALMLTKHNGEYKNVVAWCKKDGTWRNTGL